MTRIQRAVVSFAIGAAVAICTGILGSSCGIFLGHRLKPVQSASITCPERSSTNEWKGNTLFVSCGIAP